MGYLLSSALLMCLSQAPFAYSTRISQRKYAIIAAERKSACGFINAGTPATDQGIQVAGYGLAPALNSARLDSPVQPLPTVFVYDGDYLLHKTGDHHPETPERLRAILAKLKADSIYAELLHISPSAAAKKWIATIHTPEYIEEVEKAVADGRRYLHSRDTPISEHSFAAALKAAGGVMEAIDAVMTNRGKNAFCAVRPPGHHALRDRAMGFCLFNNVAIGAAYLQKKYGLQRILIVDWDVHHGNGTQDAFDESPNVLFFSVHRAPFYPGTGRKDEKGENAGAGFTLNVPLSAGSGDEEYIKVFEDILRPAATEFKPEFILISAGFDAHRDDPLGGMNLTDAGFAELTEITKSLAEELCNGRIVSVLEGGYNLEALAASVAAHITVLMK